MPESATVLQSLVALLHRPVADQDLARARLHLLDWLSCAVLGAAQPQATGFRAMSEQWATPGPCSVIASDNPTTDWQGALWRNAALGNIAEMDDVHRQSILHPGPVVIPVALAMAEQVGATPRQLLEAIIKGYEATIRVGRALDSRHYAFYHNTATAGAFGAAVAAGVMLRLSDDQMVSAIGLAGSRTGGLWQMRHSDNQTKQFHCVDAATTGTTAALMAESGVIGVADILEGQQGFFAATCDSANIDLVTSNEADWLLHSCSFKPWAACRHAHPAIDAARALGDVKVDDIDEVEVGVYQDAVKFCDCSDPQTVLQAKFSIQHAVAVTLLYQRPEPRHFAVECINDPAVSALRNVINVYEDNSLTNCYPEHFSAKISLKTHAGERRAAAVNDAWGDPENPLTEADLIAKAVQLMTVGGATEISARALIEAALNLNSAASLNPLSTAIRNLEVANG